jgi:hypothetical protein
VNDPTGTPQAAPSRTPAWLATLGAAMASGGVLMGLWQLSFLGLGAIAAVLGGASDQVTHLQMLLRMAAVSGVIATLATLPIARLLLRACRSSTVLASAFVPLGSVAMFCLLPRVFAYAIV